MLLPPHTFSFFRTMVIVLRPHSQLPSGSRSALWQLRYLTGFLVTAIATNKLFNCPYYIIILCHTQYYNLSYFRINISVFGKILIFLTFFRRFIYDITHDLSGSVGKGIRLVIFQDMDCSFVCSDSQIFGIVIKPCSSHSSVDEIRF